MSSMPVDTRPGRDRLSPRAARIVGVAGFAAAVALPAVLWHRTIATVAAGYRFELGYFVTGWTAFALIGVALVLFIPVLLSVGRTPDSRLYPRSRNAYAGWGASMYILGAALASQVSQLASGPGGH